MIGDEEGVEAGLLGDSRAGTDRAAIGLRTHVADGYCKFHCLLSRTPLRVVTRRLASVRASSQTTRLRREGDKAWGVHPRRSGNLTTSMRSSTLRCACSASADTTAARSTTLRARRASPRRASTIMFAARKSCWRAAL